MRIRQTCGFVTSDGSYTAFVRVTDTSNCNGWAQSLSDDGQYWTPTDPSGTGLPGSSTAKPLCALSADGMELEIYDLTNVDEPIGGSVAQGICSSEEQNGWTPQ